MENRAFPTGEEATAPTATGISITLPPESKDAVLRTVGGIAAAFVGASLAYWAVQNRLENAPAVIVAPQPVATRAVAVMIAAERAARIHRDIFFSNFAEAELPEFGAAELSADDVARFAAIHAVINTPERVQIERGTDNRFVTGEWIAQTSEKYFGDAPANVAADAAFAVPTKAIAPNQLRFARVEGWKPLSGGKNDRYAASVRVYEPPLGWKSDPNTWTMTETNAANEPKLIARFNATVRKVPGGYNPAYRYVLLSWKRIDDGNHATLR